MAAAPHETAMISTRGANRGCRYGTSSDPSKPPTSTSDWTIPMPAGASPRSRNTTTSTKNSPLDATFSSGAMPSTARRNGSRSTNRRPDPIDDANRSRGPLRSSCSGRRIIATATIETRYVTASKRKGAARDSPNSAPPIGPPARDVT
jgi:hypothetical protein